MITENIILKEEYKKELKHISVDTNIPVATMLIACAAYILEEDRDIDKFHRKEQYDQFTMKIDEDLKSKIKDFCKEKEIRIKDFWNESAKMAINISKEGDQCF